MKIKHIYPYRIFIISIISVVFLLALNGCFFFGGGVKEEPKKVEKTREEKIALTTPQKRPVDESRFQQEKNDVIQEINFTNADGQLVKGSLNWSNGAIRATGYGMAPQNVPPESGKPLAIEAAYTVALANLLGIAKGVQINATTTVENAMLKEQKIEKLIQGTIRGAIVLNEEFKKEDGTAIVEVGIVLESVAEAIPGYFSAPRQLPPESFQPRLFPAYLETLNNIDPNHTIRPGDIPISDPQYIDKVQTILEKLEQTNETVRKLQEEIKAIKEAQEDKEMPPVEPYTGIVVNASGSGVKVGLYPKIYYSDGGAYKLLYGDESVNRPSAQVDIWVGWARTLSDAKNDSKVKDNPLFIQAIAVNEDGDPAISAEDAEKIESLEKEYHFLEQGKVVIVL